MPSERPGPTAGNTGGIPETGSGHSAECPGLDGSLRSHMADTLVPDGAARQMKSDGVGLLRVTLLNPAYISGSGRMAKWNSQIDSSVVFWKEMICEASAVDYGVPLPKLDSQFLETWSSHYAHIASLSQLEKGFLEIGTGFGVLAAGLGKKYRVESWTIEHPSRAYFYAPAYREFLKKYGVNLVGADLCTGLPFRSGKISKVYLCDVIEHLNPVYVPYI